jgi:hypothetical protein
VRQDVTETCEACTPRSDVRGKPSYLCPATAFPAPRCRFAAGERRRPGRKDWIRARDIEQLAGVRERCRWFGFAFEDELIECFGLSAG